MNKAESLDSDQKAAFMLHLEPNKETKDAATNQNQPHLSYSQPHYSKNCASQISTTSFSVYITVIWGFLQLCPDCWNYKITFYCMGHGGTLLMCLWARHWTPKCLLTGMLTHSFVCLLCQLGDLHVHCMFTWTTCFQSHQLAYIGIRAEWTS